MSGQKYDEDTISFLESKRRYFWDWMEWQAIHAPKPPWVWDVLSQCWVHPDGRCCTILEWQSAMVPKAHLQRHQLPPEALAELLEWEKEQLQK